jgi:hypothetical protein
MLQEWQKLSEMHLDQNKNITLAYVLYPDNE